MEITKASFDTSENNEKSKTSIIDKAYLVIEKYNKSIKQSQNGFVKQMIKNTKKGLMIWEIENNIATSTCFKRNDVSIKLWFDNSFDINFYSLKLNDWFETEDYKMILPLVVLLKKQQAKKFKDAIKNYK